MTSCCHPHQMPWSGATGAIARCKRVSTGCGRKSRSVRVLRWICGVKLKPKAVNKPLPYFIVHELDKPGSSATVSDFAIIPCRAAPSEPSEFLKCPKWSRRPLLGLMGFPGASEKECNMCDYFSDAPGKPIAIKS